MDQAGWHITDGLNVPANITIIRLPPYSPELNSQENIWQYLRNNFLSLRIFDDYEAILDVCEAAWKALVATPEKITSIASRQWAQSFNINAG